MIAANGVNAVFMVESVMAVTRPSCLSRERHNGKEAKDRRRKDNNLFADILNTAVRDTQETSAMPQMVVYGRDMQTTTMYCQATREYHY